MDIRLGIGIDTGGTYTDAVIFDFQNKVVLSSAKALTTKEDLSVGILEALDALPQDLLKSAELLSLSTTLATNACVEEKGGSAKLIFFGGEKKVIDENGKKYGLPPADEMYIQESFTDFSGQVDREPDWEQFCQAIEDSFEYLDGVGIIETNAMKNSALVEKKAKELFQQRHSIPVICGHELFNELNCLQRGASTLLNARLFPIIEEFLSAIQTAVAQRGINATVVIVRSDGTLMSEKFARLRPVETLLCGPAASVMGGAWLTKDANSIVVDMGGTTTDIALVKEGIPVKVTGGVSIGKWKTFVNGLYIKTFGLGGDTAIHYNQKGLYMEDYRITPLCVAEEKYPGIISNLKELLENTKSHTKFLHEHFLLIKDISDNPRYTQEEQSFCAALKNGPLIMRDAAAAVGKDIYTLKVTRLLKEGVVQLCGLTPTDIMHIKKDFVRFPRQASELGAQFVAGNLNVSVEELCDRVYDEVKRKLYVNIVKALLENKNNNYAKNGISEDIERFINESYEIAKTGFKHEFISLMFGTDFSLIGIGAPIHIFLSDVAEMLGTRALIPKHHEVANALGAVLGNVNATFSVEIKPNLSAEGITGYTVFGFTATKIFENLEEAEKFAVSEAKLGAYEEAIKRGASGEITTTCRLSSDMAKAKHGSVYLGTRAIAQAVGALGF